MLDILDIHIQNPDLELFINKIRISSKEYNIELLKYMQDSMKILSSKWWKDYRNYRWKIMFLTDYLWNHGIKNILLNEDIKNER